MNRVPCYCNRYLVNEDTATSFVNGKVTCTPGCYSAACEASRVPERLVLILMDDEPPMHVTGGAHAA